MEEDYIIKSPFLKIHKIKGEKVLKVAFKLFVKNSIEAVSMQQIADVAEVGVASVFRYYANKTAWVMFVGDTKTH